MTEYEKLFSRGDCRSEEECEELRKASVDYCRKNEFLVTKEGLCVDDESSIALRAFQSGAEWQRKRTNGWVSTKDMQPEKYGVYLVITYFSHNDTYDMAAFDEEGWHKASRILYWMPIPCHPDFPERTH